MDVYVEDDNNTVFDIEMQTTKQKDLPKRSRYYQGMIDLILGDESIKVFVNATGARENVSNDMKAFLDYLTGKTSNNHLVKKLQNEVEKARNREEWRTEYMTLLRRDEEKREEGFNLAAQIIKCLQDNPSATPETIAEQLACAVEEVLQLKKLLN